MSEIPIAQDAIDAAVVEAVSEWTPVSPMPITVDAIHTTPIIIRWLDEEGNLLREQTVTYSGSDV